MTDLLPCPFCRSPGGYLATGSVSQPDVMLHRVKCSALRENGGCAISPFTGWWATKEEAFAVWNTRSTPRTMEGVRTTAIYAADSEDRQPPGGWMPAKFLDEVGQFISGQFYIPDGTYIAGRRVGTEGDAITRILADMKASGSWDEATMDRVIENVSALTRLHSTATQADGGTK